MSKRAVGVLLFGTGSFLLVMAFGLPFVVAPALTKIPFDLGPTLIVTEASDATFVQAKAVGETQSIEVQHADLRSKAMVRPDARATARLTGDLADRTVVWNVFQMTKRVDNDEVINAYETRIALDRTSGAAADWSGQCLADEAFEKCVQGNVRYSGHLYQFPFNTEKRTHLYYDSDLGHALPMYYRGTETVRGIEVYKFEQVIEDEQLKAKPENVNSLLHRFAPTATSARMMYTCRRTVWVEPLTGVMVRVEDVQHRTFVPDVGEPTVLFDGAFRFSAQTEQEISDRARTGRLQIRALRLYVPIGLALLGIGCLVLGFWITRRARRA
jgi:hypothetical protein